MDSADPDDPMGRIIVALEGIAAALSIEQPSGATKTLSEVLDEITQKLQSIAVSTEFQTPVDHSYQLNLVVARLAEIVAELEKIQLDRRW